MAVRRKFLRCRRTLPPALLARAFILLLGFAALASVLIGLSARAQDDLSYYAQRTYGAYYTGEYAEAEEYAERVLDAGLDDPNVTTALIRAELAQGKYAEAAETAVTAAATFAEYFPIQVVVVEALLAGGKEREAAAILDELNDLAKAANPKALNSIELVALGKAALLLGGEPKMVLTQFFQKARKLDPENMGAHLAAAELAIEKADYALASKILGEARKTIGPFPDILYLLARSYSPSDRQEAESLLALAFERNPRHLPSLLLQAEHLIDAEDYAGARERLKAVSRSIRTTRKAGHSRPPSPTSAMRRLLPRPPATGRSRLGGRTRRSISGSVRRSRRSAASTRGLNTCARRSRTTRITSPPRRSSAKTCCASAMRRSGWKLIREVQEKDKYDVETYNLMLLHDELEAFELIEVDQFAVRMTPEQAAVFGPQVVALLERARDVLCPKYGYTPKRRVVVDFFPDQQDFAIRTLGIPGGLGIVGACFGNVIAMNSPGSPGAMGTNWESTLWHEFCHTVTLGGDPQPHPTLAHRRHLGLRGTPARPVLWHEDDPGLPPPHAGGRWPDPDR